MNATAAVGRFVGEALQQGYALAQRVGRSARTTAGPGASPCSGGAARTASRRPRSTGSATSGSAWTIFGPHLTLSAGVSPDHELDRETVVTIGDRCLIGRGSGIVGHESVEIGDDVFTGHHVYITDVNHGYEDPREPIGREFAATGARSRSARARGSGTARSCSRGRGRGPRGGGRWLGGDGRDPGLLGGRRDRGAVVRRGLTSPTAAGSGWIDRVGDVVVADRSAIRPSPRPPLRCRRGRRSMSAHRVGEPGGVALGELASVGRAPPIRGRRDVDMRRVGDPLSLRPGAGRPSTRRRVGGWRSPPSCPRPTRRRRRAAGERVVRPSAARSPGRCPSVSGSTHICTNRTARSRSRSSPSGGCPSPRSCAGRGRARSRRRLPSVSAVLERPSSTQVTISMSRWGCVPNPPPGATMSSLSTISSPWWVFAGS